MTSLVFSVIHMYTNYEYLYIILVQWNVTNNVMCFKQCIVKSCHNIHIYLFDFL